MTWTQAIIVYVVCWWLLLFMVLPIGIKQSVDTGGAPQKTYLAIKCTAVMVLAALATWGIDLLIHSGIVAVR